MAIDWFTFVTQLVNFLILVWLLKRFLYRPVLEAMAKRKAAVAEELAAARREHAAAREEKKQLQLMREELRVVREDELLAVHREAEALRSRLTAEVRQESEQLRKQWQAAVGEEQREFVDRAAHGLVEQLDKLSRAALAELADESLERRIVVSFLGRIGGQEENLAALKQAVANGDELVVSTSFGLDDELKNRCRRELAELAGGETIVRFEREPALIAGITLGAGDKKISWNVDRYLDDFRHEFATLLSARQVGP